MRGRWSGWKKQIESRFAPSLGGRLEIHNVTYRGAHDQEGRVYLTWDKEIIESFCAYTAYVKYGMGSNPACTRVEFVSTGQFPPEAVHLVADRARAANMDPEAWVHEWLTRHEIGRADDNAELLSGLSEATLESIARIAAATLLRESRLSRPRRDPDEPTPPGEFGQSDALSALYDFDTMSIDNAIASTNPLHVFFSVVDRRVGKRRLKKLDAQRHHPTVRRMLDLRMECEGLIPERKQ